MNTRRTSRAFGALLLSAACTVVALPATAQQTPPDNTKVNKADRAKGAVTADQSDERRSVEALIVTPHVSSDRQEGRVAPPLFFSMCFPFS
jgi:hypothetical protein